jgi:uncharacterized OB-fold protein
VVSEVREAMKPVPIQDELSRPFREAALQGRLLIQRCTSCGNGQFYPRRHCIHCFAPDPQWVEASGDARLHTFSVVRRTADRAFADDVPYVFAVVELAEGPRMTVNVVDTPLDELRCDMPMRIVFTRHADDIALPNATAVGAT